MKLGVSLWGTYHQKDPATAPSLAEAVRSISRLDACLGVEIWGSRFRDEDQVSGSALSDLVDTCRGVGYVTQHVQGRHWSWNPTALRREIALAQHVGAETLVLHPVCLGLHDESDRPDWPEIRRIADVAATQGVRLAVENMVDSMWSLDRILETLGDDPEQTNLGICIDIGHAHQSHDAGREPVYNYLERYASQLVHLHLHDNDGHDDAHLLPGEGTVDWRRVTQLLSRTNFEGTAVLEAHHPELSPLESMKRGLAFLVGFQSEPDTR